MAVATTVIVIMVIVITVIVTIDNMAQCVVCAMGLIGWRKKWKNATLAA
jgi:hypothetical protein